jgi:hypothetical protein
VTTRSGIHDAGPLPWVMRATGMTVATLLVASCGGDGAPGLPTVTPSRSVTSTIPAATRSPIGPETPTPTATISRPTRSPARTDSPTPTQTTTATTANPTRPETPVPTATIPTATPTATRETTAVSSPTVTGPPSPTPSESPTTLSSAAGSSTAATGVPSWLWWLLAALALVAIAIPLLVSARRRRAWRADLRAAEDEVAWVARALVPELGRAGSVEQVAGGWGVGSSRVSAVEDRLTALEASAPDDAGRNRARTLRDAVRAARHRMQELTGSGTSDTLFRDLDAVAAELEAALRSENQSE